MLKGVAPEVNLRKEGIHPGFETQGKHQKSKTVAPKNDLCPPEIYTSQ